MRTCTKCRGQFEPRVGIYECAACKKTYDAARLARRKLELASVAVVDETATCKHCGETKDIAFFSRDPSTKNGRKSRCKACHSAYNTKRKEHVSAYNAAYHAKNRVTIHQRKRLRKARVRTLNELRAGHWEAAVALYGDRCLVPGCKNTDVSQDHVMSLHNGGRHHISNLQPLCASHNARKHTKTQDYRAFVITGVVS